MVLKRMRKPKSVLHKPVLITGSPRSGKTCVFDALSLASDFAAYQEPLMVWNNWKSNRVDDRLDAADATADVKKYIQKKCSQFVASKDAPRYLDNLSYHALRVPFIAEIAPDAKIVYLSRDPFLCIEEMMHGWSRMPSLSFYLLQRFNNLNFFSWRSLGTLAKRVLNNLKQQRASGTRTTWGPVVPGLSEIVEKGNLAKICAYQWGMIDKIFQESLDKVPNLQVLQVSHDELIASPEIGMKRILEFCEVSDHSPCLEWAVERLSPDYVHHSDIKIRLTAEDREVILSQLLSLGFNKELLLATTEASKIS